MKDYNLKQLTEQIKQWGKELGFAHTAITDVDISQHGDKLTTWLENKFQGEMNYMAAHGAKRSHPEKLIPGTVRVITARMDYLGETNKTSLKILNQPDKAYISRYALGRDYHKVIRSKLQKLADLISAEFGDFSYRAFCDSAPVMEKALAERSGQGWIGKHTNIINREHGSWFFLGELYTNIPLPIDEPTSAHCGSCSACIDICPTDAIVAPYQLDARKCISYLTIELRGSIPVEFRKSIGNRIYGCDDCQLVCPWNRYAKLAVDPDFKTRNGLNDISLEALFSWDEETFQKNTEGSAIRRISHEQWLRNIAVALGNAPRLKKILTALKSRRDHPSSMVREHVNWAVNYQQQSDRA